MRNEEAIDQTIEYKNHKIEILYDSDARSPRENDNGTTMICFHSRYNLGDKHDFNHNDYNGWDEMEKAIIKELKPVVIKPLFMYDHSGITIQTTPFNDRWDSGQVGFIVMSRKQALENYGVKKITKDIIERAEKLLDAEVETYDNYVTGQVFGFRVLDENDEEKDSCWGFFGDDHEVSGLMDHARSSID